MSALPATVPSADDIAAFEASHAAAAKKPGRALRVVAPPPSYPTIVTDGLTGRVSPSDPYLDGSFSAADVAHVIARPSVTPRSTGSTIRKNAPFPPDATITVLVDNPKKSGSAAHGRFCHYGPKGSTLTVAQALAAGVLAIDLVWDSNPRRKFVKITK